MGSSPFVGFFYISNPLKYSAVNVEREKATGLKEVEGATESGELTEWDRDRLLIFLTLQITRMRRGAFASYGRYLLPFAVAFPLCGLLIYVAFQLSKKKLPIGFLYLGDFFIILGIFIVLLVLILLFFDFLRTRYLESITNADLASFKCVHYGTVNDLTGSHPGCEYFNRTLDDAPLCIVCPIYQKSNEG